MRNVDGFDQAYFLLLATFTIYIGAHRHAPQLPPSFSPPPPAHGRPPWCTDPINTETQAAASQLLPCRQQTTLPARNSHGSIAAQPPPSPPFPPRPSPPTLRTAR